MTLHMLVEGRLRLEVECASGSRWEVHRIAVYSARGALDLREQLMSSRTPQ
jgi:hypothetical protein